ncbi:hypothetical protein BJY01DRAFT_203248 [Aspergillus pseudoustus]|uniref:Uncharacterized protein n=1 Tax=Aspergillus pseudoustus TaxID=1810923 RepID=A0ABR4KWN1_9EURO
MSPTKLSQLLTSTTTPSSSPSTTISPSSYFASLTRKRQTKKMSITQTYYLAHTARKKLTREASRADHNLRLLVGHANLLDSLMIDLADAEQEQERWFNQTVSGATKGSHRSESQHIQWAETLVEEPEEDDWDPEYLSDDDSDDSEEDSDFEEDYAPVRRRAQTPVTIVTETELEDYNSDSDSDSDSDSEFEYDDAEDLEELALTRSPSRQTPPELSHDEEDSEDDSMPPSPPQLLLESFDEKQPHTTEISLSDPDFETRYYAQQARQPVIEAC